MEKTSRHIEAQAYTIKHPALDVGLAVWPSAIMAVAGMGDALLYAYLPVAGPGLGIPVFMIGLLLSANKFIRLLSNRWVALMAEKTDLKSVLRTGTVLSAATTFFYALNPDIWVWVLARIFWGIAYSALRLSAYLYAGKSDRTGSALGVARSIQEAGPVIIYWTGPLLLSTVGPEATFALIGLATIALLPSFYLLPEFKTSASSPKGLKLSLPGITDIWVFVSSFAVEGLLIVAVSVIIKVDVSNTGELLLTSAFYISLRRLFNILISPVIGWLSERWKFGSLFNLSCLLILSGLSLIAFHQPAAGILVAFLGSAINTTLVPAIALQHTAAAKSVDKLTSLSTSRDLGSAFGTLAGLSLLSLFGSGFIFGALAIVLIFIWNKLRKLRFET